MLFVAVSGSKDIRITPEVLRRLMFMKQNRSIYHSCRYTFRILAIDWTLVPECLGECLGVIHAKGNLLHFQLSDFFVASMVYMSCPEFSLFTHRDRCRLVECCSSWSSPPSGAQSSPGERFLRVLQQRTASLHVWGPVYPPNSAPSVRSTRLEAS